MKFSVTTFATRGLISPEALMPRLAEWGFDGIELWSGDLSGPDYLAWYRQDSVRLADLWPDEGLRDEERARLVALRERAEAHGLEISMLSPYFDFTAGQQRWDESLAVGRRYVQYAQILGCPTIRTCGGRIPSADMTDAEWHDCIAGLKALTGLPGAGEILFCLECHGNRPEDTIAGVLREIREVGAANLKVLLQPTSFVGEANTRQILNALFDHTAHIHAGLGSKDVDWAWMLPEMAQRGYEGYLSIEGVAEPKLETIEQQMQWLHGLPLGS
jgi:sugar phosphate isomerase/epimerase